MPITQKNVYICEKKSTIAIVDKGTQTPRIEAEEHLNLMSKNELKRLHLNRKKKYMDPVLIKVIQFFLSLSLLIVLHELGTLYLLECLALA